MKNTAIILGTFLILLCGIVSGVYGSSVITPDVVITQPGQTTTAQILLDQAPTGLYGFAISCSVANQGVAEITGFQYGPAWSFTVPFSKKADGSVIAAGIDMSETQLPPGSSNILLATLTLKGNAAGSTSLNVQSGRFEDLAHAGFTPSGDSGTVTVNSGTAQQYTITVTQGSHGTITPGTVTKSAGSSQAFAIVPDSGYHVVSVIVDGVSVGAVSGYSFTNIQAAHTITATFAANTVPQYTITVTQDSHGTISPGTVTKNAGESQAFTITPESGYHTVSVIVDGVSVGAVTGYTFTNIQSAHTITATFAANTAPQYTITVTQGSHGTISPGTVTKNAGESQTFTITPDSGYHIGSVIVDGVSVGAVSSYTFTNIQAAHTITATYSQNSATQYTITVTQAAHGTISPGTVTKNAAESQTFSITPDSGYHVSALIVDGVAVAAQTSYTFTNIQSAHTLSATFAANQGVQYTITVTQVAHGTIAPGTVAKYAGESQTFSITPDTGYHVTAVIVDGASAGAVSSYTFTNIHAAHSLTATYAADAQAQYAITVTQGSHGTISPGTVTKNAGESQTFTITPESGYHVTAVIVDGASVGVQSSYTFTNIQAAHTITATYAANSATQYTITVTQGSHGTISPGTVTKNAGESQTFTVTPESGYHVASVVVDGASVGAASSYTFTNIQAAHTITATFEADTVPVQTGNLFIASSPAGANIYIDGQARGNAPGIVSVPAGQHTILVQLQGYRDASATATAIAGETVFVPTFTLIAGTPGTPPTSPTTTVTTTVTTTTTTTVPVPPTANPTSPVFPYQTIVEPKLPKFDWSSVIPAFMPIEIHLPSLPSGWPIFG